MSIQTIPSEAEVSIFIAFVPKDAELGGRFLEAMRLARTKANEQSKPPYEVRPLKGTLVTGCLGKEWGEDTWNSIYWADVVVLLLSEQSLDSGEMQGVVERLIGEKEQVKSASIVSVITDGCLWEDSIFTATRLEPWDGVNERLVPITAWESEAQVFQHLIQALGKAAQQVRKQRLDNSVQNAQTKAEYTAALQLAHTFWQFLPHEVEYFAQAKNALAYVWDGGGTLLQEAHDAFDQEQWQYALIHYQNLERIPEFQDVPKLYRLMVRHLIEACGGKLRAQKQEQEDSRRIQAAQVAANRKDYVSALSMIAKVKDQNRVKRLRTQWQGLLASRMVRRTIMGLAAAVVGLVLLWFVFGRNPYEGTIQPPEPDMVQVENEGKRYYMATNELTTTEFYDYCKDTGRRKPKASRFEEGEFPVVDVSWYDAIEYCNWLSEKHNLSPCYTINKRPKNEKGQDNYRIRWAVSYDSTRNGYRLPTASEWLVAATNGYAIIGRTYAGTTNPDSLHLYGNYCTKDCNRTAANRKVDDGFASIAPIKSFRPNSIGLYDMSGNVEEWCWDVYEEVRRKQNPNYQSPYNPEARTTKGGHWDSYESDLRVRSLEDHQPTDKELTLGFRLARNS